MKKKKSKNALQKNTPPASANRESAFKPGNPVFLILLGVIIAFVLFVRLQFIHIPFERDEGTYSYMGQLVLDGKIPYVGFYEMKPPLLFYCYAALLFLFGKTVEALHVAFMLLNIFTIIFLYFVGKKLLHSRAAGLITAASYALLSLAPFVSGFSVQAEHIMSFLLSAGLLLLLTGIEKNRLIYFFLSGVLFCLNFMVKQNGIFFLAFAGGMILIYYLLQKPVGWKQLIMRITAYSLGVLLVVAAVASVLYWQGALKECWFWTYSYASSYVAYVTPKEGFDNFTGVAKSIIDKNSLLWLLAMAGFMLPIFFRKQFSLFTLLFTGLLAFSSFVAITPGLRFYGHYWIFFMPSIALLVAVGVLSIKSILLRYFSPNNPAIVALSIFGVAVLWNILLQNEYYFNHDDKSVLRMVYQMNPFPEAKVIGDYIRQNSTDKDSMAIFGSEPEIYFYAGRRCPSKHCDGGAMLSANPYAPVFQKEYKRDMEASLPRYFVVFKNPASYNMMGNANRHPIFDWLNLFLSTNYKVVGMIDLLSPENTQYVWGDAVNQYKVQSDISGYVFERKKK